MAARDLIRNYLREAKAGGRTTTAAQVEWLEALRVSLTQELESGGQAVLSTSFKGQASTMDSGVSVRDRLSAVNAALDRLTGTPGGGGGMLIIPRFRSLPL